MIAIVDYKTGNLTSVQLAFDALGVKAEITSNPQTILEESARIARGAIEDVRYADAAKLDALFMPGGFGAAKVLSDFAAKGDGCEADPEVSRLLRDMHAAGKPIGAICIAPVVVARALGEHGLTLTIGDDAGTAESLEGLGCEHIDCSTTDFVVDNVNKIVTTPAYMLGPSIKDVATGIDRTVATVLSLA